MVGRGLAQLGFSVTKDNESSAAEVLSFQMSRGYIPQGLHGLQGFAAHGLQGFAAHGLQGLPAHGLQGFAAHGLQGLPAHGLQGFVAQGLHGLPAHGLHGFAAHGLQGLAAHGLQGLHGLFTSAPDEPYRPTLILISSLTLRKATCGLLIL